jgi:2,4-dienoyl-CoA reductase-like NADH-dependent reductase (Old Yellow Enzyme family)
VRAVWPQDRPVFARISAIDEQWSLSESVALGSELAAIGIDVVDCSSGGLGRSPSVVRVSRGYGFQIPFAEAVRHGAKVMTMAVGLILDPQQAAECAPRTRR